MDKLKLAIFISGRGSNMAAILEAASQADYPAKPALIVSNRQDAGGLETASQHRIPSIVVDHLAYPRDREGFEKAIQTHLVAHGIEIIALAGFMRILSSWFVERWRGRLINIHPSLLPKYKGLNTHARAIASGDSHAGCSVHWVTEEVDDGDVIAQLKIPIFPDDDEITLSNRVLKAEHSLYPLALSIACQFTANS